jgi:hypothetical protein
MLRTLHAGISDDCKWFKYATRPEARVEAPNAHFWLVLKACSSIDVKICPNQEKCRKRPLFLPLHRYSSRIGIRQDSHIFVMVWKGFICQLAAILPQQQRTLLLSLLSGINFSCWWYQSELLERNLGPSFSACTDGQTQIPALPRSMESSQNV